MTTLDWLSVSYKNDCSHIANEVVEETFKSKIKKDQKWDFFKVQDIDGVTIIKYHTHAQIQFAGQFFKRAHAFEEIQKIYRRIGEARIARVDICRDFHKSVEDIFPKYLLNLEKHMPSSKKSLKIGIIGKPIESIILLGRHRKIRIYNKILQLQHLVKQGKAKDFHVKMLRENMDCNLTRVEFELRSHFCKYADSIFADCDQKTFTQQVLNQHLKENKLLNNKGKIHKLWIELISSDSKLVPQKIVSDKNKANRFQDLKKAQSFIANKFKKYGMTKEESLLFLLEAFGFLSPIFDEVSLENMEPSFKNKIVIDIIKKLGSHHADGAKQKAA